MDVLGMKIHLRNDTLSERCCELASENGQLEC